MKVNTDLLDRVTGDENVGVEVTWKTIKRSLREIQDVFLPLEKKKQKGEPDWFDP